jgi:hypothetical protein
MAAGSAVQFDRAPVAARVFELKKLNPNDLNDDDKNQSPIQDWGDCVVCD